MPRGWHRYYHHGEQPHLPGYTLHELAHLLGSSLRAQRELALATLHAVLRNAVCGDTPAAGSAGHESRLSEAEAARVVAEVRVPATTRPVPATTRPLPLWSTLAAAVASVHKVKACGILGTCGGLTHVCNHSLQTRVHRRRCCPNFGWCLSCACCWITAV